MARSSPKRRSRTIALAQAVGAKMTVLRGARLSAAGLRGWRRLRTVSRKEYEARRVRRGEILDAMATWASSAGVECATVTRSRRRREAILAAAKKHKSDVIVMVARPARHLGGAAGQRDAKGAHARQAAGDRGALAAGARRLACGAARGG
jgi:nucleotide-binding universal stress UspA family protein